VSSQQVMPLQFPATVASPDVGRCARCRRFFGYRQFTTVTVAKQQKLPVPTTLETILSRRPCTQISLQAFQKPQAGSSHAPGIPASKVAKCRLWRRARRSRWQSVVWAADVHHSGQASQLRSSARKRCFAPRDFTIPRRTSAAIRTLIRPYARCTDTRINPISGIGDVKSFNPRMRLQAASQFTARL
jgi:hypothetical protein